ncbi:hypothetical protein Dimus_022327, partial [Dionaea muscipula]
RSPTTAHEVEYASHHPSLKQQQVRPIKQQECRPMFSSSAAGCSVASVGPLNELLQISLHQMWAAHVCYTYADFNDAVKPYWLQFAAAACCYFNVRLKLHVGLLMAWAKLLES